MGRRWRIRRRKKLLKLQRSCPSGQSGAEESGPEEQLSLQQYFQQIQGQPDTSPQIIAFLRWLKANGFRNEHHLAVYQYGGGQGRGVSTRGRPLVAGDELMLLPAKCMMLPSVLRRERPELYEAFELDEDCLIAVLICERGRIDAGLSSHWAPYLNLITRDYDYLPLMEANVLQRYASIPVPTSYYRLLSATLIDLERTRVRVGDIIKLQKLPILFTNEAFNWAYSVVNTRSVHPNPLLNMSSNSEYEESDLQDIALVPFFDLFNHAPFGNAQVQTSYPAGFRMITHTPVPKYSQVSFKVA